MAENIKEKIEKLISTIESKTNHIDKFASNLQKADKSLNDAKVGLENSATGFTGKADDLAKTLKNIKSLNESIENLIVEIGSIDFPERLDTIEKTVNETVTTLNNTRQATLDELQKASEIIIEADFDGRFLKLQKSIDDNMTSNEVLKETINDNLNTLISELKTEIKRIETTTNLSLAENRKFIQDLNLPIRMDKLDASIAGIIAGIQNTQGMIQTTERNVADKLRESYEKQAQTLSNLQLQLQKNNDAVQKKMQINAYITWGIIILGFISIGLIM